MATRAWMITVAVVTAIGLAAMPGCTVDVDLWRDIGISLIVEGVMLALTLFGVDRIKDKADRRQRETVERIMCLRLFGFIKDLESSLIPATLRSMQDVGDLPNSRIAGACGTLAPKTPAQQIACLLKFVEDRYAQGKVFHTQHLDELRRRLGEIIGHSLPFLDYKILAGLMGLETQLAQTVEWLKKMDDGEWPEQRSRAELAKFIYRVVQSLANISKWVQDTRSKHFPQ